MKCLSAKQPWALLIVGSGSVPGPKGVENRGWRTDYRGPLLIHASKSLDEGAIYNLSQQRTWPFGEDFNLPFGAIIGKVELVDCVDDSQSPWAVPGQQHWKLENRVAFDKPIPYPGRQGLFDAPDPDADHLFKSHDGRTLRVDVRQEPPDVMITRPGKWGNSYRPAWYPGGKRIEPHWEIEQWDKQNRRWVRSLLDPYGPSPKSKKEALNICLHYYEKHVRNNPTLMAALPELKGKRLGCFCRADEPCHGDVLVKLVNEVCK